MAEALLPRSTVAPDTGDVESASRYRVEEFYRNHSTQMWRALLSFSGDPEVASDAVAEAFAQALRRGPAIRSVERWVWKAAFRIAAGELKERRRFSPQVDRATTPAEPRFELWNSLRELSPRQRACLFLHYYAGDPPRDIARMIGSTQSAVRVHLFRGRARLAEILDGEPDD